APQGHPLHLRRPGHDDHDRGLRGLPAPGGVTLIPDDAGSAHAIRAASRTRATWTAERPGPAAIWGRHLGPSAVVEAECGAGRTAGSRLRSAMRIEMS